MKFDDEGPEPPDDELEIDAGTAGDGPDVDDDEEIEAADDDEPEVEEPVEGDDEPEVEEPAQPRRRKTQEESAGDLRRQLRVRDEELARLRAERPQQTQPVQQQQETPQARHARLAAMSPDDRAATIMAEGEERLHRINALAEFRVAESEDKAAFNEIARQDPRAKKYAAEVEQVLLAERQQGKNWPRATILKFILGDRVLANQPKAKKQQDAAATEARRQKGNPEKPKGDAGSGKQRLNERQAREKRLLNVRI